MEQLWLHIACKCIHIYSRNLITNGLVKSLKYVKIVHILRCDSLLQRESTCLSKDNLISIFSPSKLKTSTCSIVVLFNSICKSKLASILSNRFPIMSIDFVLLSFRVIRFLFDQFCSSFISVWMPLLIVHIFYSNFVYTYFLPFCLF